MNMNEKIQSTHLERKAIVYVRQSSRQQVVDHQESQHLQYAMREHLLELGWSNIEVIDDDLGRSGTSTEGRGGFERMVADVALGNVGAIAAREMSRFARNNRDWHQLLEMCSVVDTLLIDHETVYSLRGSNDRLLLGLKGSLSEYELDLLRQRAIAGQWEKAKRGELFPWVPIGYVLVDNTVLQKDPDQRVQQAINQLFAKFFEVGSVRQTLLWLQAHDISIPTRPSRALSHSIVWGQPTYTRLYQLVTHPAYAGIYAYGKTLNVVSLQHGKAKKKRARRDWDEWPVFIRDHHEGYISWKEYEKLRAMLADNGTRYASRHGAAKNGTALFVGLLRCAHCGRKLQVTYSGNNHRAPRYFCPGRGPRNLAPRCYSFGGTNIEDAIEKELFRVVEPLAINAAAHAAEQHECRQSAVLQAIGLELQAAGYEADRARRQYDVADPENRLVTVELETRWNRALLRVSELESRLAQEQTKTLQAKDKVSASDFYGLAAHLDEVWLHPETDNRLKKRIARTLIAEVIVKHDEAQNQIELTIHWAGGQHSQLTVARRRRGQSAAHTAMKVIDTIRTLALVVSDIDIAGILNRNKILTARGNCWTAERVKATRENRAIPEFTVEAQRQGGWMMLRDAALSVSLPNTTLRRWCNKGLVRAKHPLPNGPWIIDAQELERLRAVKSRKQLLAATSHKQMSLGITTT